VCLSRSPRDVSGDERQVLGLTKKEFRADTQWSFNRARFIEAKVKETPIGD
jgi:hypothetical protein